MNEDVLITKFEQLLDKKLKPVHGDIAKLKEQVTSMNATTIFTRSEVKDVSKNIARLDSLVENVNEKLENPEDGLVAINDKVGILIADVEHISTTTKATHELLEGTRDRQQDEIDNIKKHVGVF